MAWVAKALISLMARGALFLKETPCNFSSSVSYTEFLCPSPGTSAPYRAERTYPLVHMDGVLAGDNVRDGGALRLAGRILSLRRRHFWFVIVSFAACRAIEDVRGGVGGQRRV